MEQTVLLDQVNSQFKKLVEAQNPVAQMKELTRQMAKYDMTMKGKPFPTFLKPYFVEASQKSDFERSTMQIMSAIEKVADAFFNDPRFKDLLELDGIVAEYAAISPVYPNRQIVSRLDAFFIPQTGELKFIEFNCDSPSGMGWHDAMVDMFWDLSSMKALKDSFALQADKFLDTHATMLQKKYIQFCEAKGEKPDPDPLFAMVCASDSTVRRDVEIIRDVLRSKGIRSEYADPRDFSYEEGSLKLNGEVVHLIYRDAIQEFLAEPYYGHTEAALQAYREGNICFINPFSSRVGGLKSALAIMSDKQYSELFTADEHAAIEAHIPWTRLLRAGKTDFHGDTIDLVPFVKSHNNLFVLKPSSGYGGHDVVIGPEQEGQQWAHAVDQAMAPGNNFVVQELVKIPLDDFPMVVDETFNGWESKKVNINFWAFDGQFGGAFARASSGSVINVHQGGGLVPVFYVNQLP